MIGMIDRFKKDFEKAKFEVTVPNFTQEMREEDLIEIIGDYDGWIIGDDPATARVIRSGVNGRLKACMRWGVGTDNIDFAAFEKYQIPVENTPKVFGREVADLACHYVTALARQTYKINEQVKQGYWYKPIGTSLWATKALIIGMGDIGKNLAKRLHAHDVDVYYSDPFVQTSDISTPVTKRSWPEGAHDVDFVIFTAPLNESTQHMLNHETIKFLKKGIKIVNVGRGALISEDALISGIDMGIIHSAAIDVFESEPFRSETHTKFHKRSEKFIFGSHNGSNTFEAVQHVSRLTIRKLQQFLELSA